MSTRDDQHRFRFCPVCGAPAALRRLKAGEPERLVCPTCGFIHYFDPKPAVGTIIALEGGKILLVRRAIEPGYGPWVFPGGRRSWW
ncbi:MAG TPA: NUDIX hydrolase [Vicinamibacterales bacterium]|jgi:NADH pyrophosphatase NudC (nudix superfamily)